VARHTGIALVEPVHRISYSCTCLLASHCASEVDSRSAVSDVRFLIIAHLEGHRLTLTIDKAGKSISKREILFKARISLILAPW